LINQGITYLLAQSPERGYNSQGTSQSGFTTKHSKTSKVQQQHTYMFIYIQEIKKL